MTGINSRAETPTPARTYPVRQFAPQPESPRPPLRPPELGGLLHPWWRRGAGSRQFGCQPPVCITRPVASPTLYSRSNLFPSPANHAKVRCAIELSSVSREEQHSPICSILADHPRLGSEIMALPPIIRPLSSLDKYTSHSTRYSPLSSRLSVTTALIETDL